MTHFKWFLLFVVVVIISAIATPGRYFTDWCWGVAAFAVVWLGLGAFLLRKGWIRP